jgi:hypothetical protein
VSPEPGTERTLGRAPVIVDVQECADPWATTDHASSAHAIVAPETVELATTDQPLESTPYSRSWLIHARYGGQRHTLLIGGEGAPLHWNGHAGARAPEEVERAAYEFVFAERAPALLTMITLTLAHS